MKANKIVIDQNEFNDVNHIDINIGDKSFTIELNWDDSLSIFAKGLGNKLSINPLAGNAANIDIRK